MACKLGILAAPSTGFGCPNSSRESQFMNVPYVYSLIRSAQTPLQDIAVTLNVRIEEIGEPHYDDPSLALLFSQLRSKTLQAAKGTSEISGRAEFNFVLQMARVFCRMGKRLSFVILFYTSQTDVC